MAEPLIRSQGATAESNNSSSISTIAGTVVTGDLVVITAFKDASSNFTFPANFTKAAEVATLTMAAAVGWKWGTAADSGATFVTSVAGGGGANQIMFGSVMAFQKVTSDSAPLKFLTLRVDSKNFIATGSVQTTRAAQFLFGEFLQSDNIAANSQSIAAAGWTVTDSAGSSLGGDWQELEMTRSVANSGTFINPASSSLGTSHNWVSIVFGLEGALSDVYSPPADDSIAFEFGGTHSDGVTRTMQLARAVSDALSVYDWEGGLGRDLFYQADALDPLTIADGAIPDYIPAANYVINTLTVSDPLSMVDDGPMAAFLNRLVEDGVNLADDGPKVAFLYRLAADGIDIVDAAQRSMLLQKLIDDGVVLVDARGDFIFEVDAHDVIELLDQRKPEAVGPQVYEPDATDGIVVSDGYISVRLSWATLEDALALADDATLERLRNVTMMDGTSLLDTALTYALRGRITDDGVVLVDAADTPALRFRQADDAIDLSDTASLHRLLFRLVEDGLVLDDPAIVVASRKLELIISDALELTDAAELRRWLVREAMDVLEATDATLAARLRSVEATDALLTDDSLVRSMALTRAVSDALGTFDDTFLQLALTRHLSDSFALTDAADRATAITRALEDAVALVDFALTAVTGITIRVADDGVELSDGAQRVFLLRRILEDGFDLSDDALRTMRLARLLSDGFEVGDDYDAATSTIRIVTTTEDDFVVVSDASDLFRVRGRDLFDLVAALIDDASSTKALSREINDSLVLADSATSVLRRLLLASDSIETVDGMATVMFLSRSLADFLGVTDEGLAFYIADASLRYVLRIQLGTEQAIEIGAEATALIGADKSPIVLGVLQ